MTTFDQKTMEAKKKATPYRILMLLGWVNTNLTHSPMPPSYPDKITALKKPAEREG